jgi:hypothetical protein
MIGPALLAAGLLESHLLNLLVFSALVSAVFAVLLRDDTPSRLRFALKSFASFVTVTLALAWIMRPFPS